MAGMRVISPHSGYSIQLFDAQERMSTDDAGITRMLPTAKLVVANFEKSGLRPNEEELALAEFGDMFGALPEGVHPLTRVGVFDVEAYCLATYPDPAVRDEMEQKIEKRLRELQPHFPNHFTIVEEPRAALPWNTYDAESVEDIITLQERIDVDPLLVRRYEEENQKRPEIIEAMLAKEGEAVVEEEIEVQA